MKKFSWHAYWFTPGTAVNLAIFRIIIVAAALYMDWGLNHLVKRVTENEDFIHPQGLIVLLAGIFGNDFLINESTVTAIWWTMRIAGWLALLGIATPVTLFLFAAGQLYYFSFAYSFGEHHHPEGVFCMALLALAFSPAGKCLSVDSLIMKRLGPEHRRENWGVNAETYYGQWPLKLAMWLMALVYLSAAGAKIVRGGGIGWMNGYTLQTYLLQDGIRWDSEPALWLAKFYWLCLIGSIGAVLLELFFWVPVIWRRYTAYFLLAGIAMHVTILLTQRAPFMRFLIVYCAFVNWESLIRPWLSQPSPSNAAAYAQSTEPEIVFYDGNCGLCHRWVKFLLKHDAEGRLFRFAPLQSSTAQREIDAESRASLTDTIVVKTRTGEILTKSRAVLHMLDRLRGVWGTLAALGRAVPPPLPNLGYDIVAKLRHRLFARPADACPMLPAQLRSRFLY